MAIPRPLLPLVFALLSTGLQAQSGLKVDPACPVSGDREFATRVLHVIYDPSITKAITDPQQLLLDMGINNPYFRRNGQTLPLTRNGNVWEATVTRDEKTWWLYLMLRVRDEKTGQVDDNGGNFWDVLTCLPGGQLHPQTLEERARSYEGRRFETGMARKQDYAQAAAIMKEDLSRQAPQNYNALFLYWYYEVMRDGNNDAAWKKLAAEIDSFLDAHRSEPEALVQAAGFMNVHEDKVPPDLLPKAMELLEKVAPADAEREYRAILLNRARNMRDPRRKAEVLGDFLRQYPKDMYFPAAAGERLSALRELGDIAGAEETYNLAMKFDPDWIDGAYVLAQMYVNNGVKTEEALRLLDGVEAKIRSGTKTRNHWVFGFLSFEEKQRDAQIAAVRAHAYLNQGNAPLALAALDKAMVGLPTTTKWFLAGQIYELAGQKDKALDAYIRAVEMPSDKTPQQMERLERFWLSAGFGTKEQLRQKLSSAAEERFKNANYVPALLARPLPAFEFTTLDGAKFSSTALGNKTAILNFWGTWCAPCVPELPGFEELQAKHPEMLVAALAIGSDLGPIQKIALDLRLSKLHLAQADQMRDDFVPAGVPVTYLVVGGKIRAVHEGALDNVVAYIEADLAAITKNDVAAK